MFDWGHINFKAKLGWLNWMTHILNSVAAAGVLAWIVSADINSGGTSSSSSSSSSRTHAPLCVQRMVTCALVHKA
jgi:hypothetical protein